MECPWHCTERWQASDNSNRSHVEQHRGGQASSNNKEDRKITMKLSRAHKRNGLPNTARNSSSTRISPNSSPQYIKEMRTEYWVFRLPRPLPIPIFLPNVSILPYMLLISSFWRLLSKLQTRSHTLQPKVKMKTEQKLIRWTGNKTQSEKETQQSWQHLTEDTKGAYSPLSCF